MTEIKISKWLSWALRHGLDELGMNPDKEGFVPLLDLIKLCPYTITVEQIKQIVDNCPKQRFNLESKDKQLFIRANQGHSKTIGDKIISEELLTKLDKPIPNIFHGSYLKNLELIKKNGLNRMSRKHIHFAKSIDSKSGKRSDCNLIIYIDMERAMNDGIIFYESTNGVILTEGIDGIIPSKYLTFTNLKNELI